VECGVAVPIPGVRLGAVGDGLGHAGGTAGGGGLEEGPFGLGALVAYAVFDLAEIGK
jgi:hypothetical protein